MTLGHIIYRFEHSGYLRRKERARRVTDFIRKHRHFAMPLVWKLSNTLLLANDGRYALARDIVRFFGFNFTFLSRDELEQELKYRHPETWWFLGTAKDKQFIGGTCSVLIYA